MNSSIRGWSLRVSDLTFASKCSRSSWSLGSNFTPAGSPGRLWIPPYIPHNEISSSQFIAKYRYEHSKMEFKAIYDLLSRHAYILYYTFSCHLIWCPQEGQALTRLCIGLSLLAIVWSVVGGAGEDLLTIAMASSLQSVHQVMFNFFYWFG